jgi:4-amino-4-deoxy-L-arabinose transferase-like glycosyltransferase
MSSLPSPHATQRPTAGAAALRPRQGRRLAGGLGLFALLLIAGLATADHLAWSAQSDWPLSFQDSGLHTLQSVQSAMRERERPSFLHLRELFHNGYYPPFTYWLSVWVQLQQGLSTAAWPASQSIFTGALCLGTGLLGARAWGWLAGIAAAALVLCSPLIWAQRAEGMLDLPLAGAVALALGLLPSARRPSVFRAMASGLALGAALLTKQTMMLFAAPGLLWLGARAVGAIRVPRWGRGLVALGLVGLAIWALAAFRWGHAIGWLPGMRLGGLAVALALCLFSLGRRDLRPLRDLAIVLLVTLLVAGRWYAHSVDTLVEVLAQVEARQPLPRGMEGLIWRLSFLPWLRSTFLFAPLAWAWTVGLLLLPLGLRRPGVWLLVLGFGLGLYGLTGFSDPHDRHYLALLPLITAIAVAPVGLLARASTVLGGLLCVGCVSYGAVFVWGWREPDWGRAADRMGPFDGQLQGDWPTTESALLRARWNWVSGRWVWLAPRPPEGVWPIAEAVRAVVASGPLTGEGTVINAINDWIGPELIRAEATVQGAIFLRTAREGQGGPQAQPGERSCWIWAEDPTGRESLPAPSRALSTLEELARLPAALPERGQPRTLLAACTAD